MRFCRRLLGRCGPVLLIWASACAREIGDDCITSADCVSTDANRLCISEQLEGFPGGYCTVFNCEPGSCPGESVCIGYRTSLANAEACSDTTGRARLQRTYCMRHCRGDGDCRSGYACIDVAEDNPWGAEIIESGARASRTRICAVPYSEPPEAPERESDVCQWRPPEPVEGADAGGPAGVDASLLPDAAAPDAGEILDGATPRSDAGEDASRELTDASRLRDAALGAEDASSGVDATAADASLP